jgi:hypothetical protein
MICVCVWALRASGRLHPEASQSELGNKLTRHSVMREGRDAKSLMG